MPWCRLTVVAEFACGQATSRGAASRCARPDERRSVTHSQFRGNGEELSVGRSQQESFSDQRPHCAACRHDRVPVTQPIVDGPEAGGHGGISHVIGRTLYNAGMGKKRRFFHPDPLSSRITLD